MRPFTLFVICAFFCVQISHAQYVMPYPDNSPKSVVFESVGMPEVTRVWDRLDYETAFTVLDQVLELDKFSLPRAGSKYSAELFSRLTSFENFAHLRDSTVNLGQRVIEFEKIQGLPNRLLLYYVEGYEEIERFGAEVLECKLFEAYVRNIGLILYDDLLDQLGERASTSDKFLNTYNATRAAGIRSIADLMRVLAEDHQRYDVSLQQTFANRLFLYLQEVEDPSCQDIIKKTGNEILVANPNESVKEVIKELLDQL